MDVNIGSSTLTIVEGDITKEATDAIVNAANSGLRGEEASTARFTARAGPPSWRSAGRSDIAPRAGPS